VKPTILTIAVLCAASILAPQAGLAQSRKAFAAPVPPVSARQVRHAHMPVQQSTPQFHSNAVAASIPVWQATDGSYTYQMVGGSPLVAGAGSTTVQTPIVPLALTFSDGTKFDPTQPNSCASNQAPTSLVQSSPIFANTAWNAGGVNVGTTQYPDFFQRASFWSTTGASGGLNPNYHLLLSPSILLDTTKAAIAITVPAASGSTASFSCGKLGEMDINWFDNYVQTTLFSKLATLGVLPSQLPIFLLSNVVLYQGTTASCCILGYHSGFNNNFGSFGGAVQTYAVADFETSGAFGAANNDVATLSHEIAEWVNDPTGNNPVPAWGHIGQQSGCQTNLEVGDPLSGTGISVVGSNAYTYHLQELAFKSWFYRDAPSSGVNGWYSSNGTFKTPSTACETSTTTLTVNPTTISAGSSTTLTVKVAAGSGYTGTPTGTATVVSSLNGSTVATYTLSGGTGTSSVSLPAGSYNLTANYSGDSNFGASSSSAVAVTVGSASVSLSPVSLTFATTTVGTATAAQTVTLKNLGTAPITISSISLTGASPADFSQTNTCGTAVAVNATCTISVAFKPTAAGSRTASVSIADKATGSPQTLPLSGTGVAASGPQVSLNPTSLTFASTTIGSSASLAATVTNSGNASLTGVAITVAGTNAADYSQTNTCGTSVAAGSACTITVMFKPSVAGTRTASLSVADNATGAPQTLALTGTGANPAPAPAPGTV
jgi:hypothetical protein